MKVSYNWLCEILPGLNQTLPRDLARRLTFAGLEVEEILDQAERLKGIVVARVLTRDKHPQADRLSVCTVQAGDQTLQVVCGAPNVQAGKLYPFATLGTKMPDGLEIKPAKLRGVESSGMLCSARELQLSEEASGLLELPETSVIGKSIAETLGLNDVILTLNITPNRGDALGHWGVARDIAALTGLKLDTSRIATDFTFTHIISAEKKQLITSAQLGNVSITISDTSLCNHYVAAMLDGVRVAPSPSWLQNRLVSLGIRPISNVVDATNYVMLLTGHPVHAFDASQIRGGKISVTTVSDNTKFKALDGQEYELQKGDPVIADGDGPVALAGIMGGENSGVSATTTWLILETAHFDPSHIRRTARRIGLVTESSYRFERAVNPETVTLASRILAALILHLAGGRETGRVSLQANELTPVIIELSAGDIKHILGTSVPPPDVKRILDALGCNATVKAGGWSVLIPASRSDLCRKADLVEEIARIYGLDKIPEVMPHKILVPAREDYGSSLLPQLREFFIGQGFYETIHYSFGDPDLMRTVLRPHTEQNWVTLKNPLSADLAVMRPSLLPGLISAYRRNVRLAKSGLRFFECRNTYLKNADGSISEKCVLAALYAGNPHGRNRFGDKRESDFFDGKGVLENLFRALRLTTEVSPQDAWPYHPFQAAKFSLEGVCLATLGALHPELAQELKIVESVYLLEIDFNLLAKVSQGRLPITKSLSPLPPVYRDLALVAPTELSHQEIMKVIAAEKPEILTDVELFDFYEGAPLPAGKKSLAYAFRYESPTESLTDQQVNDLHFALVERLTKRLDVQLR